MFGGLEAADVERVWQFLRSSADPIAPTQTTWDEIDDAEVSVVTALERGAVAAAGRCPTLLVALDGVTAHGVTLPWLGVFICTDAYWTGREDWGRGIATRALQDFLQLEASRPLYAGAASDNAASIRVLTKCGFRVVGEGRGFAHGRNEETDEVVLRLDA